MLATSHNVFYVFDALVRGVFVFEPKLADVETIVLPKRVIIEIVDAIVNRRMSIKSCGAFFAGCVVKAFAHSGAHKGFVDVAVARSAGAHSNIINGIVEVMETYGLAALFYTAAKHKK